MEVFSSEKLVDGLMVKTTSQTSDTSYYLTLELNDEEMELENANKFIQEMRLLYKGAHYAIDKLGWFEDDKEWFYHQENLLEFSKKHPEILFVLYAESNYGSGKDNWRKYFKNGKLQLTKREWRFPDFNYSMLE